MASYHFNIEAISRGKGNSITCSVSYITGRKLVDDYNGKTYFHNRQDVLFQRIFLPESAPEDFHDLQLLSNAINAAEKRYDARTGRVIIGSLPNEMPIDEQIRIVKEFIGENITAHRLCAIVAIHEGRNDKEMSRSNPHAHIILPTREVTPDGFSSKKNRELDKKEILLGWRKSWADLQNLAYERNGLDMRVSHESMEVQGKDRLAPIPHLSRADYEREKRGERTSAGDRRREAEEHNRAIECEKNRSQIIELTRSR